MKFMFKSVFVFFGIVSHFALAELPLVTIGYFPDIWSGGTITIAEQKGYFEKAGIRVESHRFTSGAPAVAAVASGHLNISYVGLGPMPTIMRGVAKIVGFDNITYSDQILVQQDSNINSVEDLKNKTVITPRSSGSQILLYLALKKANLTPRDIKELGGSPATIVSAMISKQVVATAIWSPFNAEIESKIKAKVLISARDFYPDYVWPGIWIANNRFTKNSSKLLQRALYALQLASDWRAKNPVEAAQLAAKRFKLSQTSIKLAIDNTEYLTSKEIADAFLDGTVEKWMKGINTQLQLIGTLRSPIESENFIQFKPYLAAQKEGVPK